MAEELELINVDYAGFWHPDLTAECVEKSGVGSNIGAKDNCGLPARVLALVRRQATIRGVTRG